MSVDTAFDPDRYLARIGLGGDRAPDTAALREVCNAHIHAIPFENLDPLRGSVPSLAPSDVVAKLVDSPRGGYCYEHNTLLSLALRALGFRVTPLMARVVLGAAAPESRPRTHMTLLVEVAGEEHPWLADAGFGAAGSLLEAVPLVTGAEFRSGPRTHRFVHAPHDGPLALWVLQARTGTGDAAEWADQYAFTVEPFAAPDFEVANWHVATNPRSPFSRRLHAQCTRPGVHRALDDRRYTETRADGGVTERLIGTEEEARALLAEEFGIVAPEDMKLLS
ncbi:arylamine N-acetyltransferase family protein [Streptomyces genisteinicus]|uniref:Arylamine N-acetyltransferase n=1 Tax=Streptomyces genisteinicus TaxID=2768068 RepID=A0A7H0HP97_9ACTN|nr:arylamine N-acetyltransferase [Streptomyces genisteinicus]QNP62363.1 arylamine N-acetyltransferase [Streptomyces genisteinicus]